MDNNLIEKIIEIPANKFIDTAINTVIIVFNKNKNNSNIEFVYENGTSEKPDVILEKVISMEEEIQRTLKELRGNL